MCSGSRSSRLLESSLSSHLDQAQCQLTTAPVHLPHATELFGVEVLQSTAELALQVKHNVCDYSSKIMTYHRSLKYLELRSSRVLQSSLSWSNTMFLSTLPVHLPHATRSIWGWGPPQYCRAHSPGQTQCPWLPTQTLTTCHWSIWGWGPPRRSAHSPSTPSPPANAGGRTLGPFQLPLAAISPRSERPCNK